MSDGTLVLAGGGLLALGIAAALLAGRLRVPGLVLFLAVGMVLGSDGLGVFHFDNLRHARTIGVVALALILFEGGYAAGWDEIRPVLRESLSLATVGTVLTAVLTGLVAAPLLDLSLLEGLLLGAIVAASDAAAIFSTLRGSRIGRRLARTLEGESAMNDPVAILLVIGLIDLIQKPSFGAPDLVWLFAKQLAIGGAVGFAAGRLANVAFHRLNLMSGGLYPVLSIATAAISFGAADVAGGSGFLAVYLTGLVLGSAHIPASGTIGDFHAGLGWVSQIALFVTLGLLVSPSHFGHIALEGVALAATVTLAARPVAVFVATRIGSFSAREVLLLAWGGLRGAVPIVLATYPVIDRVPHAASFFDLVFFVVLASALVQGATFEPLARFLALTTEEPALPRPVMEVGTIRRLGAEVVEYPVTEHDAIVGCRVNQLGLPDEALVSVIVRRDHALVPDGTTTVEAGDRLHVLFREKQRAEVERLFDSWQERRADGAARPS